MFDYGLYRATTAGGPWTRIYSINNPGAAATSATNRVEFATASLAGGATRIYLGDSTYFTDSVSGLLRTDDATATTPAWTPLSNATKGTPGYGVDNFCHTQCSYDMVVASPPALPDEVFLSGSMNYNELQVFGGPGSSNGRAVVRSANAGVNFTDMTNDARPQPNGLHPDHHALLFVSTGSGGRGLLHRLRRWGRSSSSGPYVDHQRPVLRHRGPQQASTCSSTRQHVPRRPSRPSNNSNTNQRSAERSQYQSCQRLEQCNGAVQGWHPGQRHLGERHFRAAGPRPSAATAGSSGVPTPPTPAIRCIHSYYSPAARRQLRRRHSRPAGTGSATRCSAPGRLPSFYVTAHAPIPVTAGTVFDGLQHIWRTTDNGGPQAYLDLHCNELTGDFSVQCGDWVTLGGAAGDLSGGNTANYVVAVEARHAATPPRCGPPPGSGSRATSVEQRQRRRPPTT